MTEAMELMEQSFGGLNLVLGDTHPDTLSCKQLLDIWGRNLIPTITRESTVRHGSLLSRNCSFNDDIGGVIPHSVLSLLTHLFFQ